MRTSNPWLKVLNLASAPYVADIDKQCIKGMNQNLLNSLKLDLYPEPFAGNPEANIYLLNGNPGFEVEDYQFLQSTKFKKALDETLNLRAKSFLYLDSSACTHNGNLHPGLKWWRSHLKQLIQSSVNNNPNIFNIEYFPYHSVNMVNLHKYWIDKNNYLPSDSFVNELIQQAIENNKIIVIMRLERAWYNRIPSLQGYGNLIVLRNSQSVHITPNNVRVFVEDKQKSQSNWDNLIHNC